MTGWSTGAWGYTPWGGGVEVVSLDSLQFCPSVVVSGFFGLLDYCDVATTAEAKLTHQGRSSLASMATEGRGFQIKEFSLGRGGFDLENPLRVTEVEDLRTVLLDEIYRDSIDDIDWANNESATFVCRVTEQEVWSVVGELGLWAQITHSFLTPEEVGSWFLFAVAHFPMISLICPHTFRIVVQF